MQCLGDALHGVMTELCLKRFPSSETIPHSATTGLSVSTPPEPIR